MIEETPAGRFAGDDDRGVAGLAGRLAAGGILAQFDGAAAVRRSRCGRKAKCKLATEARRASRRT